MRRRELLLSGAALMASGTAPAANAALSALDGRLQALQADERFPLAGLSVLLMRKGVVVHEAQFGMRHYGPELPVTRDTLFRVASVSKFFTSVVAMRLAEQGKLDLDADIGEVLGRPVRNPNFPKQILRVRMLMEHTSSMTDEADILFLPPGVSLLDELDKPGKTWSAEHGPGYFQYCNLAYGLLATVLEKAGGQRFDKLAQSLVLAPLGMQGGFNTMDYPATELANVATLYRKQRVEDGKEIWDAHAPWRPQVDDFLAEPPKPFEGLDSYQLATNGTIFGPQGRMRTRVADLGTMLAMLMDGGMHQGQRFLKKASIDRMFTETWRHNLAKGNGDTFGGGYVAWGLGAHHFIDQSAPGWGDRLIEKGGLQGWGHRGFAYGVQTGFMLDAARQHGIVYVMSGHAADPSRNRGRYSAFPVWEERLQDMLWSAVLA
ncbi:MAG: beta-lactamase family protein [Paucibacter sp.]|nr:beta-lactamase family protein [Roseateles sp.]